MKINETTKTHAALAALAAAVVLVVAACGGGDDSSEVGPSSNSRQLVSVGDAEGIGDVLVDSGGLALYAADEETNGTVLCTQACLSFWDPLTVPSGMTTATGDPSVESLLGVIERPEGDRQVTFEGMPLYRFTEDGGPGEVTGDGFEDDFGGQHFTWHVATPAGLAGSTSTPRDDFDY
jgi:predicted lipoprotein with Yx(FWY)xxD motif